MIIGNLNQLDMAMLPLPLFQLLSKEEFSHESLLKQEDGKYDIIEGALFYIIASPVTDSEENLKSEFHNEFLDIQLLLSGQEVIATSSAIPVSHTFQEVKPDLIFVDDAEIMTRIMLQAGDFAIFYPGEVHRPTCQVEIPQQIKKAIFKISKTWLANH